MATFKWSLHRKRYFTRLSLVGNLVILLYIFNVHMYVPSTSQIREMTIVRTSRIFSGYGSSNPFMLTSDSSDLPEPDLSIVLYGMREHWFIFCNYTEFAQYKYLITFPRVINCPGTNRSIFLNYTKEPLEISNYDVVVFSNVYEWLTPQMWDWTHGNRSEGQRWVMITEESPLYVPGVEPPAKYADLSYDWFDAYKSDSDFVHPYGKYEPFGAIKPAPIDITKYLINKSQLVAWMGSHCETLQWDRMKFVGAFKKIINLHTYGKCGDEPVAWNNDQIIFDVLGKYKFYLSLENSCCDEYLTEKFWRALEMGLVPVVVGAPYEHYVKYAPPNSFIHVDQFDSLTELAVHLIGLNSNDEKYLEYHQWRNVGRLISYGQEEQYVRPLNNETQCAILTKYFQTDPNDQKRIKYFGKKWFGSCNKCGAKEWVNSFMHPDNYTRDNADIWAR